MSQRVLIPEPIFDQTPQATAFLHRLKAAQREANDWTHDDDLELAYYAHLKSYCDLERQFSLSEHRLFHFLQNHGPQYVTKAAMLFLDVLYPSHQDLIVYHRWIDKYGYARAAPRGIKQPMNERRPAPPDRDRASEQESQAGTATAGDSEDAKPASLEPFTIRDNEDGDEYAPVTGSRAGRSVGAQSRDNTARAVPCASEAVAPTDMTLRSSVEPKKASRKRAVGSSASAAYDNESDASESEADSISHRTRRRLAPPVERLPGRSNEAASPSRLDGTAATLDTPIPNTIRSVSSTNPSSAPSPMTVESNLDFVAKFEADAAALVQRLEDWDKSNQNIAVARQNINTNSSEDATEIVLSMRRVHDSVKNILNNTMEAAVAKVDASSRWVESVELLISQGYKVTFTSSTPTEPGA